MSSLPILLSRSPAGLFRLVAFLSSTAVRMPLDQIGPLLRRKVGRQLMDAVVPVPNTSYSKQQQKVSTAVVVTNTANANVTTVVNDDDVAIAEPQMMQTAMATTTGELDDVDANANNEEEQATTTTTSTTTTTTLDDDAAAWSRTRFERKERIERTYSSMTRTAGILRAQMAGDSNNNKNNSLALSKVVATFPNVLLLDVEKQILPVARYLIRRLGIWKDDLASVLQIYPTLLGKTIEDPERVVAYVLSLGVEEDDLTQMFRTFPVLFTLRPHEDMEPVVEYLQSIGVKDVGAFVTTLPPVLGYSVDDELKPKWEFLKTVCLQPEFELKEFPPYFSYPFGRVIMTRFNYFAYKGRSIRFVSMRIDTVLRFGDIDFARTNTPSRTKETRPTTRRVTKPC